MNKISTLKIALSFIAILVVMYSGYEIYAHNTIDSKHFSEIEPGKVTLLGIDAGNGYKIIVSNEIAQLVQVPNGGKLEADQNDIGGGDEGDSTDKRHVPLKETVLSLQGDANALSELVTIMNDDLRKQREDIPPNPVIWKAEDIQKAIAGDAKLKPKLEHDLNMHLDGTPVDYLTVNALFNGITIDLPVPVLVNVKGHPETLVAHVKVPYRPNFTRRVEQDITNDPNSKTVNPTPEVMKGFYLQEAQKQQAKAGNKEDIVAALQSRINDQTVKSYAEAAERVLGKTRVILNETFIKDASMDENTSNDGKPLYDLVLNLTDEGRDRLWKYSRTGVGSQLLLIVDGVAIAAPRVTHELAQSTVTITQMPDKALVQDAIDDIKSSTGQVASK